MQGANINVQFHGWGVIVISVPYHQTVTIPPVQGNVVGGGGAARVAHLADADGLQHPSAAQL